MEQNVFSVHEALGSNPQHQKEVLSESRPLPCRGRPPKDDHTAHAEGSGNGEGAETLSSGKPL